MKDENLYICRVPLKLKHLYTSPTERTIDESFGSWWVVSKNMTTRMVRLAQSKDDDTRMQISLEMLEKHFEVANINTLFIDQAKGSPELTKYERKEVEAEIDKVFNEVFK